MEEKKPTTVGGKPTGDITESGNPDHNPDGTFGTKEGFDTESVKEIKIPKKSSDNSDPPDGPDKLKEKISKTPGNEKK